METREFIDLSHPLSPETPPFPGDPGVEIRALDATTQSDDQPRDRLNCSNLAMCVHCGTHMDAPFHFFGNGATIDQVPLETCVGETLLIDLAGTAPETHLDRHHLVRYQQEIRDTRRVVLNTGWYRRWASGEEYFTRHPVLTEAAARFLIDCGVRLIGVDFPSVDRPPHPAHIVLLGNGAVIIENLTQLDRIAKPRFRLIAVPLSIVGRDGSPVRAIAEV